MDLGFLLPAIAGALGVAAVTWLVNRPNAKRRRSEMRFGPGMMTLLAIASVFFLGLGIGMVLGIVPGRDTEKLWVRMIFLGFGTLSLFSFLDGLTRRLRWDKQGVEFQRFLNAPARRDWDDLTGLTYHSFGQFWRVQFKDGSGFGFSETMSGAHAFLRYARDRGLLADEEVDASGE